MSDDVTEERRQELLAAYAERRRLALAEAAARPSEPGRQGFVSVGSAAGDFTSGLRDWVEEQRAAGAFEARPDPTQEREAAKARERRLGVVPRKFQVELTDPTLRVRTTAPILGVQAIGGTRTLLFALGPHDAGKSFAGACMIAERGGLWVDAAELVDRWLTARPSLLGAGALVLDEIGREGGSPEQRAAVGEALASLIGHFGQNLWPLIVTGNLQPASLKAIVSAPRRGEKAPNEARWELVRERLREHGVLVDGAALSGTGGEQPSAGYLLCPHVGLREFRRRP